MMVEIYSFYLEVFFQIFDFIEMPLLIFEICFKGMKRILSFMIFCWAMHTS